MRGRIHALAVTALLALLVSPLLAGAAQFAPSSLFLSKDKVTEGDTVLIHAVVQNNSTTTFPGNLVIRSNDSEVGSVPVTLSPNEVRAVSVSWTPRPGTHEVVAALLDKSGTTVQSERKSFKVEAKPKPIVAASSSAAAAVESSDSIRQKIDSVSPAAGNALSPLFRLVDGSRSAIAEVLDAQIEKAKPKVTTLPAVVAGADTSIETPEQGSWFSSIFYTIYFYILTVLRFVVGSAGIFYPLLAIIFFYILWRMFRRFRRD